MDQTINEMTKMVYCGRIARTVEQWRDQQKGNTAGGSIISADGTAYKKSGKFLVQVVDPRFLKILAKRLVPRLVSDGLVPSAQESVNADVAETSSELIAEL